MDNQFDVQNILHGWILIHITYHGCAALRGKNFQEGKSKENLP
ncbi:hypothetical protein Nmel_016756, partial [Mimus melanotis]